MNYKTKITHSLVETITQLIAAYLTCDHVDMDDKLVMATLGEVKLKMQKKLLQPQKEYPFTFSPAEAIALSIWFDDYLGDHTTQVGNKLHTISSQVKKQYT